VNDQNSLTSTDRTTHLRSQLETETLAQENGLLKSLPKFNPDNQYWNSAINEGQPTIFQNEV